ncbi:MAG: hypothetical protein Kow0079_02800 [Vicingaceae bacterium]
MRDIKVASRYAKSILDLSIELNQLEEVYKDMIFISNTCKESKDLSLLLKSPIIKADKKESILKAVFGEKIGKITASFITILTTKGRESLLAEIADYFIKLYKKHKNIETAQVISAIKLPDNIKNEIADLVKKHTNSDKVELNEVIDKEIIGGLILRLEDKQYDNSIIRKLNDLKAAFSDNLYIKEF